MPRNGTAWVFGSDADVRVELENRLAGWRSCEPHEVLGVTLEAGDGEIRAAFLRMTKELHPNRFARRGPDLKKLANEVFLAFKSAHQSLRDVRSGKRRGSGRPGTMSQPIPHVTSASAGRRRTPSSSRDPSRTDLRPSTNPLPAPPPPASRPRRPRQTLEGHVVPQIVERPRGPTPGSPDRPPGRPRVGSGKNRPGRAARRSVKTDTVPVVPPPGPSPAQRRLRRPAPDPAQPSQNSAPPPRSRVRFRATTPTSSRTVSGSRGTGAAGPVDPGGAAPAWTSEEVERARALLAREKWKEAAQLLQSLVAAMPDNHRLTAQLHYARAKDHRERGNLVDANIELRRALEADPGYDDAKRELADLRG